MEREERRLEQYRQLRKESRGSQEYLVVGIDISKDRHDALMRTVSGKILYKRLTFNNTREGFEMLLKGVGRRSSLSFLRRQRVGSCG